MLVRGVLRPLWGQADVSDRAEDLFGADAPVAGSVTWTRSAQPFFQGNRYLIGSLVRGVLSAAKGDRIVDLYAGVGLFSVALAASGARVMAVEGDPLKDIEVVKKVRFVMKGGTVVVPLIKAPLAAPDRK